LKKYFQTLLLPQGGLLLAARPCSMLPTCPPNRSGGTIGEFVLILVIILVHDGDRDE
jgi:hypothetical protein